MISSRRFKFRCAASAAGVYGGASGAEGKCRDDQVLSHQVGGDDLVLLLAGDDAGQHRPRMQILAAMNGPGAAQLQRQVVARQVVVYRFGRNHGRPLLFPTDNVSGKARFLTNSNKSAWSERILR